jgi:hypothetical protein
MLIKGNNDSDALTIPLDLAGCTINFRHRLPTTEGTATLKQYCLIQGDAPWNPSPFTDQVADKFL